MIEPADAESETARGGYEESKKSQEDPHAGKEMGFLAFCMYHASARNWLEPHQQFSRRFRDPMRLIQLEELLMMKVSSYWL